MKRKRRHDDEPVAPSPRGCLVLVLVGSGVAVAARGDPQKKIKPADQARARAMLLRAADLPGFRGTPSSQMDDDFYCRALDESDLTLTGEAESPDFQQALVFVSSLSQVYESRADATTSWLRGTSAAGVKCLRDGFRREITQTGGRFISFRQVPFPRLAERSVAFRVVGVTQGVRLHLDFVVLMRSRAQAAVVTGSVPAPAPRAELERMARIVADRMARAMRGG